MPPKRQIALQETVESQEEWNNFVSKQGLQVMDIYTEWCGPCKAVIGLFRRLKNELGDDLLRFAIAKSNTIDFLEPYRGRSEPTFLMYSGGVLVHVVRGAMGPQLEKSIKTMLELEHKVIDEGIERTPVEDEGLDAEEVVLEDEVVEEEPVEEQRPEPTPKECTVMVIKPDAVQAGKIDEILERLKAEGMEVLAMEERVLSKEEATEFYKQHEGLDHFEELVEFMTSGPCMTLVLTKGDTGEGVLEDLRAVIGPKDVELAKTEAPESLRATFGTDAKMNAVHASDSKETAARELAFFLPRFKVPWVPGTEPPIEKTLALIRPEALAMHGEAILEKINEAGFEVAFQKELTLTKEQAMDFYKEHEDKDFYDSLTTSMSSGPMLALCLAREEAVSEWRKLLGPKILEKAEQEDPESSDDTQPNLRAQFSVEGEEINPLHGSSNPDEAEKEIGFFFPVEKTLAVIKPGAINEQEDILSKIEESGFKISMSKKAQLTKEMAEQLYSEHKDSEYFEELTTMMTSGPSLFMVLSREDAVLGWRALMGPMNPEEAKDQQPNSIRAQFGQSIVDNAVHGSSNNEHALKEIDELFAEELAIEGEGDAEEVAPKGEGDAEEVAPKGEGDAEEVAPKGEGDAEEVAPKGEVDAEEVAPKGEGDAEEVAPKGEVDAEEVSPKGEGDAEEVAPKGEGDAEEPAPKRDEDAEELPPKGEGGDSPPQVEDS